MDAPVGSANQKGTVMGILRSLGALARALGPVISSTGKKDLIIRRDENNDQVIV